VKVAHCGKICVEGEEKKARPENARETCSVAAGTKDYISEAVVLMDDKSVLMDDYSANMDDLLVLVDDSSMKA
jgi:hypothetical protein